VKRRLHTVVEPVRAGHPGRFQAPTPCDTIATLSIRRCRGSAGQASIAAAPQPTHANWCYRDVPTTAWRASLCPRAGAAPRDEQPNRGGTPT
jgi:hypothetical protein